MNKDDDLRFEMSSGNVFLDIGFDENEAEELTVKSSLIIAIDRTIEARKLTQKKAAAICGTDQPTFSKVLRGRMESITIGRLAFWLTALGQDVRIVVSPGVDPQKGHLQVASAI